MLINWIEATFIMTNMSVKVQRRENRPARSNSEQRGPHIDAHWSRSTTKLRCSAHSLKADTASLTTTTQLDLEQGNSPDVEKKDEQVY